MPRKKITDSSINEPIDGDQWRKRMDAETLAQAKEIMKDPKRKQGAAEGAKIILEEGQPKMQALRGIARSAPKKRAKR